TATPDPRRKYAQSREGCGWEAEYPATKATVRQRQFEARQLVPPARKESPAEAGQVHAGRKIKMKSTLTPRANRDWCGPGSCRSRLRAGETYPRPGSAGPGAAANMTNWRSQLRRRTQPVLSRAA